MSRVISLELVKDVTTNCFIDGVLWMVPAVVTILLAAVLLHYFPYGSDSSLFDCTQPAVGGKAFGKAAL